ncbi:MAG: ASKHA domain-containing protein [Bacillota bacterium]
MTYKVTFLPYNISIMVDYGTTIKEAAIQASVELEGPCGGKGTCGKCLVHIPGSEHSQWTLACKTIVEKDIEVEIPQLEVAVHRKSTLTAAEENVELDSPVRKVAVKLPPESLANQVSDASRLLDCLGDGVVSLKLAAIQALPRVIRQNKGLVTAIIRNKQVLMVEAGDTTNNLVGMAVDIGTTTVVVSLVNLSTGETLNTGSATNIQNVFGADVIARIEYVIQQPTGLMQLQRRVVQVINRLARELSESIGILPEQIYQVSVAGNTTMSHLFLGVDPRHLAPAPFIPAFTQGVEVEAKEVGLAVSPHAMISMLPNVAGYVGGDTVGVILSTGIYYKSGIYLAVDIGTNGEIVLAVNGEMFACSTAAGPAFEGAQIKCGMRAAAGAIEALEIEGDVQLRVIGDMPPKGICGSGLIDAIAELVEIGIVDTSGRMITYDEGTWLPDKLRQRLGSDASSNYFVLADPSQTGDAQVVLTQKDVRELQLAKAAMRAGIETLLIQAGVTAETIDKVLLAGAFGSYIKTSSALRIGLLPAIPAEKVTPVGNAAGAGAKLALISQQINRRAAEIAAKVKHVELSARPDFQDRFVDALTFE